MKSSKKENLKNNMTAAKLKEKGEMIFVQSLIIQKLLMSGYDLPS